MVNSINAQQVGATGLVSRLEQLGCALFSFGWRALVEFDYLGSASKKDLWLSHILASDTESDVRYYEDFNANNAFAVYLCTQQQHLKLGY